MAVAPLTTYLGGFRDEIANTALSAHHLAVGCFDNTLYIVDLLSFEITQKFEFDDTVSWLEFYTDDLLISCSLDGSLSYFKLTGD